MNLVFTCSFYILAAVLLCVSLMKDKNKTLLSLKKAWRMFINVIPQFVTILLFVGLALAALPPDMIKRIIGEETGFIGMLLSSFAGAVTLAPVMIAFPIAAELFKGGAGVVQTAVFISTLTMVGLLTLPMEMRYLGKKAAILRNALAFLFSFVTAYFMGALLK